jgi:hypothetical protein
VSFTAAPVYDISNRDDAMPELDTIPASVRQREAIKDLLDRWSWTHFITLATNDPTLSVVHMRRLIKQWDARVNRTLNGPRWHRQPDTRLWAAYALENPNTNPHWHVLVMIDHPDPGKRAWQLEQLPEVALTKWIELVQTGTVDVQRINHKPGAIDYVAKQLINPLQYDELIFPGERP